MNAQPDVASISAAATVRNLLAVAAAAPACFARFAELDTAQRAVTVAQAKHDARRDAFTAREKDGRAKLAKSKAALAERRDSVEQAEATLADAKEICAARELEWNGLGLPKDAPANEDEDEEQPDA
jgi:hypothetical protein